MNNTPHFVLVAHSISDEGQEFANGLSAAATTIIVRTAEEVRALLENQPVDIGIFDEALVLEAREILTKVPTIVAMQTVGIPPPEVPSPEWEQAVSAHEAKMIELIRSNAFGFLQQGDAVGPMIDDFLHYYPLLSQERGVGDCLLQFQEHTRLELARLLVILKVAGEAGDHVQRVGEMSAVLLEHMGYTQAQANLVGTAAMYHDAGKTLIPQVITRKPGTFTPPERTWIERHPQVGFTLLQALRKSLPEEAAGLLSIAEEIALHHHERMDGQGYPQGLRDTEISVYARATSVTDVYDALRSPRPYKPSLSHKHSIEIMAQETGTKFDATLFALLGLDGIAKRIDAIREKYAR